MSRVVVYSRNREEILDGFIETMKPYRKEHVYDCDTLNELVGTLLLKDKKEMLLEKYEVPLVNFLAASFPAENILLHEFTQEVVQELVVKKKLKCFTPKGKGLFVGIVLKSALDAGVFVPYALKFNNGEYVKNYITAMKNKIKAPKTLYEYFLCGWRDDLGKLGRYNILQFFRNNANVYPEEFELNTVTKYYRCKTQRAVIKANVLLPLQKKGILSQYFFETAALTRWIDRHLSSKVDVPKAERTIMWYVAEVYKDEIANMTPKRKVTIAFNFKELLHIKAVDFSSEDFKAIQNGNGAYREVIERMISDGVCSYDIFKQDNEDPEEFDWSADVWHYSRRGKYDFTKINEGFREPAKIYMKEVTKKLTKKVGFINELYFIFEELSKVGVSSMPELTEDKKKRFYMVLKSMEKQGGGEHAKAIRLLERFRSFIQKLQRLDGDKLNKSLKVTNDYFSIKQRPSEITVYDNDDMLKILKFIKSDESITGQFMSRIEVCAFGLLALLARRIGEIVKSSARKSTGLRIDAIKTWGISGEYGLSYYSPKHEAFEYVLLSDLVCDRTDPFGEELVDLVLSLFNEAVGITSKLRKILPIELKDLLFIVPDCSVGYKSLTGDTLSNKMFKVFEAIGVERKNKTSHKFRHTMATNIILSGGTIADAADALGDTPQTIVKSYQDFTSRIDTLKHFAEIGRTQMVDAINDSAHFNDLDKKQHKVLMPSQMSEGGYRVVGGNCVTENDKRLNCPTFQMTNSPDGCVGCRHLEVNAVENKDYWIAQMKLKAEAIDSKEPGSQSYRWESAGLERAKNIVEEIEQRELENDFN